MTTTRPLWLCARPGRTTVLVCVLMIAAMAMARAAAREYSVTGMVVSVDRANKTFSASIQAIPNYMQAMTRFANRIMG